MRGWCSAAAPLAYHTPETRTPTEPQFHAQDLHSFGGALLLPDALSTALDMEERANPDIVILPPPDPEAR
jgi:hypothetical protein